MLIANFYRDPPARCGAFDGDEAHLGGDGRGAQNTGTEDAFPFGVTVLPYAVGSVERPPDQGSIRSIRCARLELELIMALHAGVLIAAFSRECARAFRRVRR